MTARALRTLSSRTPLTRPAADLSPLPQGEVVAVVHPAGYSEPMRWLLSLALPLAVLSTLAPREARA